MADVSEIMSKDVTTLPFSSPVAVAARQMRDRNVGVIVVTEVEEPSRIYGVVTDRDLIVRAIAEGKDPNNTRLAEVCSRQVATLGAGDGIKAAEELMAQKAIRRIPVTQGDRVVGIVSLGDLARGSDRASALARISAAPPNR